MRERLAGMAPEEARRAGDRAASVVARLPVFQAARRVGLFASLPDELPTGPLHALARAEGKPVLWPRFVGEEVEYARCDDRDALVPGRYGARVPPPHAPSSALAAGDLVLVPGRAFDPSGARLGRGGGHFDRLLDGRRFQAIGLAYACQLVDRVPVEPHDEPVDAVVAGGELVRSRPREDGELVPSRSRKEEG